MLVCEFHPSVSCYFNNKTTYTTLLKLKLKMEAIIRQLDFLLKIFKSNVFGHCCQDIFCKPLLKIETLLHTVVSVMTHGRFQVKDILIDDLTSSSDDPKTMSLSQLLEFIESEKSDYMTANQKDADHICVQSYLVNLATDIAKLIHKYSIDSLRPTIERPNSMYNDLRNSEMVQDSEIDLSQGIKAEPSESDDVEISVVNSDEMKIKAENYHEGDRLRKRSLATPKMSNSKVAKIQLVTKQKRKKMGKKKNPKTEQDSNTTVSLSPQVSKRKKKAKGDQSKTEEKCDSTVSESQKAEENEDTSLQIEEATSDLSDTEETEQESSHNGNNVGLESQSVFDTRQDTSKKVVIYKQFMCFLCQPKENEATLEYKSYKDLMQHILNTHVQPRQKRSIDHKTVKGKARIECGNCNVNMRLDQPHLAQLSAIMRTSRCSSYWLIHQISKHGAPIPYFVQPFKCDVMDCNFVSVSRHYLFTHNKLTHGVSEVSCLYCQKQFKASYVPLHMKICEKLVDKSERKHFKCPHCEMSYVSKVSLEKHIGNEHDGNKQQKLLCSICSQMVCDQYSLNAHMLQRHGINITKKKVFSCTECPWKGFKSQYTYHMKMKHPAEMCTCNVCGKQFKNQTYLRNHLESHLTEKKFKCQHCTFETTTAFNLKIHNKATHLYPKKYSCPWCNYQSGYTGNMSKHKRICKQKHTMVNQNPEYEASVVEQLKNQFVKMLSPPTPVAIPSSKVHKKVTISQKAVHFGKPNKLNSQSVEIPLDIISHDNNLLPLNYSNGDPDSLAVPGPDIDQDIAIGAMHDGQEMDPKKTN